MGIFSKNHDYNLILEHVLDNKNFSANVKSLLLSMLYKIETSYLDYTRVKRINKTKDEILSEITGIVSEYFYFVKTVEPESKDSGILKKHKVLAITNEKERSILAYPTESAMLYAIADIEPKYYYIEKYSLKSVFQQLLVEGYNLNILEIVDDFNGWSWNSKVVNEKNFIANIIYQNLLMLLGNDFMENARKSSTKNYDIIKVLKENCTEYYEQLTRLVYIYAKNEKAKALKKHGIYEEKIEEENIKLQQIFIKVLYNTSKNIKTKDEFIDIIYKIRYYRNIYIQKDGAIKDYIELEKLIYKLLKRVLTIGAKNGYIKMCSMNIDINAKIFIKILDTNSIELEDLRFTIDDVDKTLIIDVYENDTFERKIKIKYKIESSEILVRKKRKMKIFA